MRLMKRGEKGGGSCRLDGKWEAHAGLEGGLLKVGQKGRGRRGKAHEVMPGKMAHSPRQEGRTLTPDLSESGASVPYFPLLSLLVLLLTYFPLLSVPAAILQLHDAEPVHTVDAFGSR